MHVRQDVPRVVGLQSVAGLNWVENWPKAVDFAESRRFRTFEPYARSAPLTSNALNGYHRSC